MRKICVITGSRAEYGLLSRLIKLIDLNEALQLQIIATNMHLAPEFGMTYKEIEADGFCIDKKVYMLLSGDTENATTKSVGIGTIGFADAFEELRPDLIVVLGDRYEILAAVSAALFYKIPVAHIHGGEITEGAYDDSIRHAITKMSHLHFTSTKEYRKRVIQMGEDPEKVFFVGALGCDNIKNIPLLSKAEVDESIGFPVTKDTFIVTFHPATLEEQSAEEQFEELLKALRSFKNLKFIFTMPNSDTGGNIIMQMIKNYVSENSDTAIWFSSLGIKRYLSLLKFVGGVIGNSSSGIIEVPSFQIPTINIGDRQKGRIFASSVFNCSPVNNDIRQTLEDILSGKYADRIDAAKNPYEKENTADEIIKILNERKLSVIKKFYDLP